MKIIIPTFIQKLKMAHGIIILKGFTEGYTLNELLMDVEQPEAAEREKDG